MDKFSLFLEKELYKEADSNLERLDEATKKIVVLSKSLEKIETIKKDFEIIKEVKSLFKLFAEFSKMKPSTSSELSTVMKKRNDISELISKIAGAGTRILKHNDIPDVGNVMDLLGDIAHTTQRLFRQFSMKNISDGVRWTRK